MVPSEFKQIASRIVLGVSLLGAVVLGARSVYGLYEMRQAVPEETTYIHILPSGDRLFIAVATCAWPVLLYLGALLLAKKEAWSRFGRAVGASQAIYICVLLAEWNFVQSLIQSIK